VKINAKKLIKPLIPRLVKSSKSPDSVRVHLRVRSALGLSQAHFWPPFARPVAPKASLLAETEVVLGDEALESEETLHVGHHCVWARRELLGGHQVELLPREEAQPREQVICVLARLDRPPGRVHFLEGFVSERQLLELGKSAATASSENLKEKFS
jgi:hypothetical protein